MRPSRQPGPSTFERTAAVVLALVVLTDYGPLWWKTLCWVEAVLITVLYCVHKYLQGM